MESSIFAERFQELLKQKNIKQVDLIRIAEENGVKLGKSQISQYVSGKTLPRKDMLQFLADILQTTPDWLLGKEESSITTVKGSDDGMRKFNKSLVWQEVKLNQQLSKQFKEDFKDKLSCKSIKINHI